MVNIIDCSVGDCLYANLTIQSAPVFCEIIKVLESENALEVVTKMWGQRVVIADNAYWEEKDAKKNKIIRIEHNYKQWAQEYFNDEETKTDDRIDSLHNRESEKREDSGKSTKGEDLPKSSKRKQKVVRKSTTRKRNTKKNRKTSRK